MTDWLLIRDCRRYMGFHDKPGPSRFTAGMQQVMATQNSSQSGPAQPLVGAAGMGYFPHSQVSSGSHRVLPHMGSQVSGSNVPMLRANQSQSQVHPKWYRSSCESALTSLITKLPTVPLNCRHQCLTSRECQVNHLLHMDLMQANLAASPPLVILMYLG